jgi:L-ascorbate metabolism protein UlaG (beta-lactamase superfamily)
MTFKLTGSRLAKAIESKQFRNGRFHNTFDFAPTVSRDTLPLMGDLLFGGRKRMPKSPLPVLDPVSVWHTAASSGLRVTWLGHSALFLEIDGARILIDPMFGNYAAPFPLLGRRRFHPVPARLEDFPPIDLVIQSHDHYDHLSVRTWKKIARMDVPVVTSLGVGARLERLGVNPSRITELDWWEGFELPDSGVRVVATPAQHFSGRGLGDRNATLWSSWVFETAKHRVFFSGDTGLNDELRMIGERYGPFDLTMLEIGASNAAWADIHLGPANALKALQMLGGGTLLPIHWGTFDLALHVWDEPANTLLELAAAANVRVITPRLGEPVEPSLVAGPTPWWRGLAAQR